MHGERRRNDNIGLNLVIESPGTIWRCLWRYFWHLSIYTSDL